MNTDRLKLVIIEGDKTKRWGAKLADGHNFYKMLFKMEQQKKLEYQKDVCHMFASFNNWNEYINSLIEECNKSATEEDARAVRYAEVLKDDVIQHIHRILMDTELDPPTIIDDLAAYATEIEQKKA